MTDAHWLSTAKPEVVAEIVRQGEARVLAQVDLAKASDVRALGLLTACGALAAGSAALLGSVILGANTPLKWLAAYATFGFMISACYSLASAWPRAMFIPGWNPAEFRDDVKNGASLTDIHFDLADSIDRYFEKNAKVMAACGKYTKASMIGIPLTTCLAVFVSGAEWLMSGNHNIGGGCAFLAAAVVQALVTCEAARTKLGT